MHQHYDDQISCNIVQAIVGWAADILDLICYILHSI